MTKKFSAVIFDLDGTLLNTQVDIIRATTKTISHFGKSTVPEDEIKKHIGYGVRDLIHSAFGENVTPEFEATIRDQFNAYYLEHCLDTTTFMPGGAELMAFLSKSGVPMAIWTNKPVPYTNKILKGLGIYDQFAAVYASEGGYPNKPHREGTDKLLQDLKCDPADVLMVGDTDVDLMTGEAVGMPVALHLSGFSPRDEIESYRNRTFVIYENLLELQAHF